ncbi:hypothetical protein KIF24_10290 [Micromonospora sp. Llam7]|uniref:hypothetical protein n=1 Tax=Micromonospora tarapacensis TaxID=2835305 RepID=UPI001C82F66A|nr:hypothetical protein [Micromonospora tarapacensis]MBX7266374.1 hypothetical protein [Micromonospora tarapacensis]
MKRLAGTLVLVVRAAASTGAGSARRTAHSTNGQRTAGTANDVMVTLVTGDRVVIPGGDLDQARVEPAEGRDDISFDFSSTEDRLDVVPSDATPRLATRCWTGGCSTSAC